MSRLVRLRNTKSKSENEIESLSWDDFLKQQCAHCGGSHLRACPRVKRMQFSQDGKLVEIEFWADGKWDQSNVLWPEDDRVRKEEISDE